jgi:Long-chain acyl-CoA synthetases (AMP-forming)
MAAVPSIHIAPLRGAHTCYVMRRFELESYLSNLERFQINEIIVVPPLVIAIIMSPLSQKYSLKSLRDVVCGAAPLDKEPQSRFRALLDAGARVTQGWGMTESTCAATMFRHPEDDTTGSVGRLIPNMEAK